MKASKWRQNFDMSPQQVPVNVLLLPYFAIETTLWTILECLKDYCVIGVS